MPIESIEERVSSELLNRLPEEDRALLKELDALHGLSQQQLRQLSEASLDLSMWQEPALAGWFEEVEASCPEKLNGRQKRDRMVKGLMERFQNLKGSAKRYDPDKPFKAPRREPQRIEMSESDRNILGDCPVYSDKLVCCQLKTLDVVQNCAFGCSYCTIQTFYGDEVKVDGRLKEKLLQAEKDLDMNTFHHIGTGQSSDSLVWGNKGGILDDLCGFAERNPKLLLEFKTKSANVRHLLSRSIPKNLVCSWSLNTKTICDNEEHFAASLDHRIGAARKAADAGVKVAFHFHPVVWYEGWKEEYLALVERVQREFLPEETLFVSFGSVTFIKPVIQEIRKRNQDSKMLQMEMVPDPHGKLSYPDEVKVEIFETMYEAFRPWRNKVFQYLCMERAYFWDKVFGWHYPTNDHFSSAFAHSVWEKVYPEEYEEMKSSLPYLPILHSINAE